MERQIVIESLCLVPWWIIIIAKAHGKRYKTETHFFMMNVIRRQAYILYQGGMLMELWITIGLTGVLAAIAGFLIYYIRTVLDFDDTRTIDSSPSDEQKENE